MIDDAQLRADLIRDEGLRLKPYQCTAGKLTIGVGRNLDDVGISHDEAMVMLDADIARAAKDAMAVVPNFHAHSAARQRALVNMCFNLGRTRLAAFRNMLAAIERGDWETAAEEALSSRWARQVGARADRIATLLREG